MRQRRAAFTLVEVLVVLAVIGLLVAILLPVFAAARESGRITACRSNLRQMSAAVRMYADDHDGLLPAYPDWGPVIIAALRVHPPFSCPDVQNFHYTPLLGQKHPGSMIGGYAYNAMIQDGRLIGDQIVAHPRPADAFPFPATTVMMCDAGETHDFIAGPDVAGGQVLPLGEEEGGIRHRGGANYSFLDGHVHWYRPDAVTMCCWGQDGTHPSFQAFP